MDDSLHVYPIEVLHVVNPHVIFAEARNSTKELVIEQIGIYGVIPVNQTIDIDGRVVVERSENWPAVATTVISDFLAGHIAQTYFMPVQEECRSSIFNSNLIKFGYIFIKSDQQVIRLNDHLVKYYIAEQNEELFQKRLSSGSLKLKLSYVRSEEVLKAIRQYYVKQKNDDKEWKDALNRQTSIHQESVNIASKLTAENLKRLQKNEEQQFSVMEVIDRKVRDLELCKDADEVPLGRAFRQNKFEPPKECSLSNIDTDNNPGTIFNKMKKFLDSQAKIKHSVSDYNHNISSSSVSVNRQGNNLMLNDDTGWDDEEQNFCESAEKSGGMYGNITSKITDNANAVKENCETKHSTSWDNESDVSPDKTEREKRRNFQTKSTEIFIKQCGEAKNNRSQNHKTKNNNREHNLDQPHRVSKFYTNLKRTRKTPERLVAIGPPSSDIKSFKIQCVKGDMLTPGSVKLEETTPSAIEGNSQDDGTQEDSDVNYEVNNAEHLKNLLKNRSSNKSKHRDDFTENRNEINAVVEKNINNKLYTPQTTEFAKQHSYSNFKISAPEKRSSTSVTNKMLLKLIKRRSCAEKTEHDNSISSNSDTSVKDTSSSCKDIMNDEDDIESIKNKLNAQYKPLKFENKQKPIPVESIPKIERKVNPFRNLDGSKSVFVDKLVGPILMVHTKNDNLILPQCNIRDVPFKTDIHIALKNMNVKEPFRLQTVSWNYILRGHSFFMVGPAAGGKTMGYIPAVCNLVMDAPNNTPSLGPICVIVCATAASVTAIEEHCRRLLGLDEVVLSCYAGIDMAKFMPALLNGCHILVSTAAMLYRLLGSDLGVDLRRLNTLVFEDGKRLSEVYASEIKVILHHVKDMLKKRADTYWKVQYVIASRQWCDFMTPLAKLAPDTIIAISAFQECVPYSKASTSVQFVMKDNKVKAVLDFLDEIDCSKRTVIVCRTDDEVETLETELKKMKHALFACNNTMTVHDLYNLNVAWDNYHEPVMGPILICCDGNLTHLNVTSAHYLVHFSMPELFSMFCKRFAVLNENYPSIFGAPNSNVKIKILLEESNAEQLPKILNFVKRCTNQEFPILSDITRQVLERKDVAKAKKFVPICNTLMALGECADLWNCRERHAILQDFDQPKPWVPNEGTVNFKILHYDSAVTYSARVLSNVKKPNSTKYPNNFSTLSLKMGMYYSKESNRKPQGVIKLGDICAVAVKLNFYERCQVVDILSYSKGRPHIVRVNLIDEEKLEDTRDIYLYHLPDEFKAIETHVVKVRLANIQPQDKDVTFSALAMNELKKITNSEENMYLRGEIIMTIGNCIFVDSLEACQDLSSLGETVVKYDFKKELLSRHAEPNPQHIPKLERLCGVIAKIQQKVEVTPPIKTVKRAKWAHLDKKDISTVIFAAAEDAGKFFVRLEKFQKVINSLASDIQRIVESSKELPQDDIYVGNILLAEFPDDKTYERARIDSVISNDKVKCFFVDNGDWRDVSVKCLRPIPDHIMHRVPFQAIECRLVGVKPHSDDWTEFGTNWLCDNCFETSEGTTKYLFAKYFTKEEASVTGGYKYGVILIDTSTETDIVINKQMIELNLARENEEESEFLNEPLNTKSLRVTSSSSGDELEEINTSKESVKDLVPVTPTENSEPQKDSNSLLRQILVEKPIRSVPLVNDSDASDSDISVHLDKELLKLFKFSTVPKTSAVENEPSSNNVFEEREMKDITNDQPEINKGTGSDVSDGSTRIVGSQVDSDDFEISREKATSLKTLKCQLYAKKVERRNSETLKDVESVKMDKDLDSDDVSSVTSSLQNKSLTLTEKSKAIEVIDPPRKPKLIWRQNKGSVSIKIQLIGVENYNLDIKEKYLKFSAHHNDTNYEFEFELYGVVNVKKCRHSSKGQYILVVLAKIVQKNWLNLAKDCTVKNWITYDVDAIESASDEESITNDDAIRVIRKNYEKQDTDSEDDDFVDDLNFRYVKRNN